MKTKCSAHETVVKQNLRHLVILCLFLRVIITTIAFLASYLPVFDSSADVVLVDKSSSLLKRWISTSLRWDSFHFLHIAQGNYQFEYQWAFLPGVPIVLRTTGWIIDLLTQNVGGTSNYNMLLGHFLVSSLVSCETVRTLYFLTMEHTHSSALSLLSGYLYLLPSSPTAAYLAPYAEPWFTLFSYRGMLFCAQKRWFSASFWFALASLFRSNGVLLCGFVVWGMVVEPFITHHQVKFRVLFLCIFLSVIISFPFTLHQLSGYLAFCARPTVSIKPSWCTRRLPLIYSHVQSHYWNVGFMRYWTMEQLPNFLLAAPVLLLLSFSSVTYILRALPMVSSGFKPEHTIASPMLTLSLLPHAIHAFIFTCMLLFASHTQIILRLASSMPFTYWSAARLFFEHPNWAKAWVIWSVVWGAVSITLWSTFMPPA